LCLAFAIALATWFGRGPTPASNAGASTSSIKATYGAKPDYIFQPWNFGDLESKKTCLWAGRDFIMPPLEFVTKPVGVKQSIWRMPPSSARGDLRSETFPGFARAVFEANAGLKSTSRRAAT
jgi:hypothetical protein